MLAFGHSMATLLPSKEQVGSVSHFTHARLKRKQGEWVSRGGLGLIHEPLLTAVCITGDLSEGGKRAR